MSQGEMSWRDYAAACERARRELDGTRCVEEAAPGARCTRRPHGHEGHVAWVHADGRSPEALHGVFAIVRWSTLPPTHPMTVTERTSTP